MAKHDIYFAHAGEQRKEPPPLELKMYMPGEHDPDEVIDAGYKFGKWLMQNTSGSWMKGLRRFLRDNPVMDDDLNITQEKDNGPDGD